VERSPASSGLPEDLATALRVELGIDEMMKATVFVGSVVGLGLCGGVALASAGVAFEGGDGGSCEQAIVIKGARNEFEGVSSEYRYLSERHPGWKLVEQSLLHSGERSFDLLEFTTSDGKKQRACFDISDFFQP
jgi:hypothetical protein